MRADKVALPVFDQIMIALSVFFLALSSLLMLAVSLRPLWTQISQGLIQ